MQVSVTNGGTMELVASGLVFPHFRVVSNQLSTPRILVCPIDKNRTSATNFENDLKDRNLSYFINVDSIAGNGSSLLCGDRNLRNKLPSLAAVSFASPAPPSSAGTGICTGRQGTSPSRTDMWLRSLTALLAQPCGCLWVSRIAWQSRSRCEDAFADRMTNILYPKIPFASLPAMLGYAVGRSPPGG